MHNIKLTITVLVHYAPYCVSLLFRAILLDDTLYSH